MGPSMARKEKGTGILPSTSDGNYSRGYPDVSRGIAYDEDAISRLSFRVATRATISAILSQKFQFWRLFSYDFLTCRVASSRVTTRAIFGAGDAIKFGKIASPARAKNRSRL